MIYLDTSLIISYVDEEDPRHADAEELIESVGPGKRVISPLVLVEFASVYSRANLEKPLRLAFYSVELIEAEEMDIDFDEVLKQSLRLAPKPRLRTLARPSTHCGMSRNQSGEIRHIRQGDSL